jgi:hypothetical protein
MDTIHDVSYALDERGLSAKIFNAGETSWVVWLYAADDPELGVFIGESDDLRVAFERAIANWDNAPILERVIGVIEESEAEN